MFKVHHFIDAFFSLKKGTGEITIRILKQERRGMKMEEFTKKMWVEKKKILLEVGQEL